MEVASWTLRIMASRVVRPVTKVECKGASAEDEEPAPRRFSLAGAAATNSNTLLSENAEEQQFQVRLRQQRCSRFHKLHVA